MSSKTKILVFHMKELIYTGIFILLGILFVVLLAIMFSPKNNDKGANPDSTASLYIPGIYSTSMVLGSHTVDVEVMVSDTDIESVTLKNLDDAVTTMYPLIRPTFEEIANQIEENQSIDAITYSEDNKYTSLVLLDAIRSSLEKASVKTNFEETYHTQQLTE